MNRENEKHSGINSKISNREFSSLTHKDGNVL